MDNESIYEKWRTARSNTAPSSDFGNRVMDRLGAEPTPLEPVSPRHHSGWYLRAGLCAAAALAAVLRVFELFSVFSATSIGN